MFGALVITFYLVTQHLAAGDDDITGQCREAEYSQVFLFFKSDTHMILAGEILYLLCTDSKQELAQYLVNFAGETMSSSLPTAATSSCIFTFKS